MASGNAACRRCGAKGSYLPAGAAGLAYGVTSARTAEPRLSPRRVRYEIVESGKRSLRHGGIRQRRFIVPGHHALRGHTPAGLEGQSRREKVIMALCRARARHCLRSPFRDSQQQCAYTQARKQRRSKRALRRASEDTKHHVEIVRERASRAQVSRTSWRLRHARQHRVPAQVGQMIALIAQDLA